MVLSSRSHQPLGTEPDLANEFIVATHEAGHVIAHLKYGWVFDKVIIYDHCSGAVSYCIGDVDPVTTDRFHEDLIITLAGFLAEELGQECWQYGRFATPDERELHGKIVSRMAESANQPVPTRAPTMPHLFSDALSAWNPAVDGTLVGDIERVHQLVEILHPKPSDWLPFLRQAELQTEKLLAKHWDDVARLACSLERRRKGYMTYREVCCLLGKKPKSRQPHGVRELSD